MDYKGTVKKVMDTWAAQTGMSDEVARFISQPAWARHLTDAIAHQGKVWFWSGVGGGLIVGLVVGAVIGHYLL